MSLLSSQLSALRERKLTQSVRISLQEEGVPSVLWSSKDAARIDIEDVYDLALEKFLSLCESDSSLCIYEESIMGRSLFESQRVNLTEEKNAAFSEIMDTFLSKLSRHLCQDAGLEILEYLVRHFHVHIYEPEMVLSSVLPYYNRPSLLYSRVSKLVRPPHDSAAWTFSQFALKNDKVPLSFDHLLKFCLRDTGVFKLVLDTALVHQQGPLSVTFASGIALKVLEKPTKEYVQAILRSCLPSVLNSLLSEHSSICSFALVLVNLLFSPFQLSGDVCKVVLNRLCRRILNPHPHPLKNITASLEQFALRQSCSERGIFVSADHFSDICPWISALRGVHFPSTTELVRLSMQIHFNGDQRKLIAQKFMESRSAEKDEALLYQLCGLGELLPSLNQENDSIGSILSKLRYTEPSESASIVSEIFAYISAMNDTQKFSSLVRNLEKLASKPHLQSLALKFSCDYTLEEWKRIMMHCFVVTHVCHHLPPSVVAAVSARHLFLLCSPNQYFPELKALDTSALHPSLRKVTESASDVLKIVAEHLALDVSTSFLNEVMAVSETLFVSLLSEILSKSDSYFDMAVAFLQSPHTSTVDPLIASLIRSSDKISSLQLFKLICTEATTKAHLFHQLFSQLVSEPIGLFLSLWGDACDDTDPSVLIHSIQLLAIMLPAVQPELEQLLIIGSYSVIFLAMHTKRIREKTFVLIEVICALMKEHKDSRCSIFVQFMKSMGGFAQEIRDHHSAVPETVRRILDDSSKSKKVLSTLLHLASFLPRRNQLRYMAVFRFAPVVTPAVRKEIIDLIEQAQGSDKAKYIQWFLPSLEFDKNVFCLVSNSFGEDSLVNKSIIDAILDCKWTQCLTSPQKLVLLQKLLIAVSLDRPTLAPSARLFVSRLPLKSKDLIAWVDSSEEDNIYTILDICCGKLHESISDVLLWVQWLFHRLSESKASPALQMVCLNSIISLLQDCRKEASSSFKITKVMEDLSNSIGTDDEVNLLVVKAFVLIIPRASGKTVSKNLDVPTRWLMHSMERKNLELLNALSQVSVDLYVSLTQMLPLEAIVPVCFPQRCLCSFDQLFLSSVLKRLKSVVDIEEFRNVSSVLFQSLIQGSDIEFLRALLCEIDLDTSLDLLCRLVNSTFDSSLVLKRKRDIIDASMPLLQLFSMFLMNDSCTASPDAFQSLSFQVMKKSVLFERANDIMDVVESVSTGNLLYRTLVMMLQDDIPTGLQCLFDSLKRNSLQIDPDSVVFVSILSELGSISDSKDLSFAIKALEGISLLLEKYDQYILLSMCSLEPLIVRLIELTQNDLLFEAAVSCLSKITQSLGVKMVPHLNSLVSIVEKGMSTLSKQDASLEFLFCLWAAFDRFLVPHYPQIIQWLLHAQLSNEDFVRFVDVFTETPRLDQLLVSSLANFKVPSSTQDLLVVERLHILVQCSVSKLDRTNFQKYRMQLLKFSFMGLTIAANALQSQRVLIDTFTILVMKLQEDMLKPVLLKLAEWSSPSDQALSDGSTEVFSKILVVLNVLQVLVSKLKGIMLPHLIYFLATFISILTVAPSIGESCSLMSQSVVLTAILLKECFRIDKQRAFIQNSVLNRLMSPLVSLLECFVDHNAPLALTGNIPESDLHCDVIVPCIVNLFELLPDEHLQRPLNKEVLSHLKSRSAKARYLSLLILEECFRSIREPFLGLLPEILPALAETMEDDSEIVISQCHSLIRVIEKLSGESIMDHFSR